MSDVDMEDAVMLSNVHRHLERELIHMHYAVHVHPERKKFRNNVLYSSKILQKLQRKDPGLSGLGKWTWTYSKANVIETKAKRILHEYLRKVKGTVL
jgi:hypothetical protein